MVNEGAKILEEDIAQRASDIDVVWLYGYGWPRHKGGPMFWADQIGLATVVQGLERYAVRIGEDRSEEHTSELQSLMRISYAVFCLKKNNTAISRQVTRLPHIKGLRT